ncbi:hypothetical protein M885DRAFT_521364 [Pelagophyceae sp. CCMP2097]|nr:hypothetical protein M885DRAFT_521364 [Pelagophyceae sp. CCMP2097]
MSSMRRGPQAPQRRDLRRSRRGNSALCLFVVLLVGVAATSFAIAHFAAGASSAPRDAPLGATAVAAAAALQRLRAAGSYEKPLAAFRRIGTVGATWKGAWRAASEPGGVYMGSLNAIEAVRLAAVDSVEGALGRGHYTTHSKDSVSVDPISLDCARYVYLLSRGVDARKATDQDGPVEAAYPRAYGILELTSNWPPDTIEVPPRHYASLCRFDYNDELQHAAAVKFRDAELPFIVVNNAAAMETAAQWSTPGFLEKRLGRRSYTAERSDDNHFMYYGQGSRTPGEWQRPTTDVRMTYAQWLESAARSYNTTILEPHYYFRVSPPDVTSQDVPIFTAEESLFVPFPKLSKGAHCRFGAAGIVAEAHYDGSRNFVAELGGPPSHANSGRRRYVMAAPRECAHAYLLPRGHPSGRHSQVDWSRPVDADKFPLFQELRAFEAILEAGDVLYIPHLWIHYVQSLGTNFQCNARSGHNEIGKQEIAKCGFL